MPCFRPKKGFVIGTTENGCPKYRITPWTTEYVARDITGAWRNYEKGDEVSAGFSPFVGMECDSSVVHSFIPIPCGNCLGCRLDYAKEWTVRLLHEYLMHPDEECWFLTLTYNDDALAETFLPPLRNPITKKIDPPIERLALGADSLGEAAWFPNLYARDMTLFWKRLRKKYPDKKIMYYQAGEYGETRGRCHWHAIVFGLPLDIDELKFNGVSELGDSTWRAPQLEKLWHSTYDESRPLGNVIVGKVTAKSCGYVARYTLKKAREMWEDDFTGRVKPFVRMSTNPAIGLEYIKKNLQIFDVSQFYIPNGSKSFMVNHPRYYMKYLKGVNPVRYEELKEDRSIAGRISYLNTLNDGRDYLEILKEKELDLSKKMSIMKRKAE